MRAHWLELFVHVLYSSTIITMIVASVVHIIELRTSVTLYYVTRLSNIIIIVELRTSTCYSYNVMLLKNALCVLLVHDSHRMPTY